ncbi:MAG: hypothetical protein FWE84_05620 [Firmicutes bacterium]|nr:hypothetical protein [Bacillota bacterium]
MNYQTKLDEIAERLARLKISGGVSHPLAGVGGGRVAQIKQNDELLSRVLTEIAALKKETDLSRGEVAAALEKMRQEIRSLAPGRGNTAGRAEGLNGENADEEAFGDILDELSALKRDIKSILAFDKE